MKEVDLGDEVARLAVRAVVSIALALFIDMSIPEDGHFAALVFLITYYSWR